MKLRRYTKRILFSIVLISLVVLSMKHYLFYSPKYTQTIPSTLTLQDGDIILRKESNHISDIFAHINESKYSHIATIAILKEQVKAIHIEDTNEKYDFKITDINEFIAYASTYAIYRPIDKVQKKRFFKIIQDLKKQNPSFDMDFNGDSSDNKIYCTELAKIIYDNSTKIKLEDNKKEYMNYSFIPISIFSQKQYFRLIYEF